MDQVLIERRDRVALLTLNRPDRLNAISGPMLRALSTALLEADADEDEVTPVAVALRGLLRDLV